MSALTQDKGDRDHDATIAIKIEARAGSNRDHHAVSLLLGGSLPAFGFHDPAPLLHERHIEGPVWIAYRVAVEKAATTIGYELANPILENRHQVA